MCLSLCQFQTEYSILLKLIVLIEESLNCFNFILKGGGGDVKSSKCTNVCAQLLSHIPLLATPWAVAHQAPLSMEFYRQEYWSGFPFPTPGDLPYPGIKTVSLVPTALVG